MILSELLRKTFCGLFAEFGGQTDAEIEYWLQRGDVLVDGVVKNDPAFLIPPNSTVTIKNAWSGRDPDGRYIDIALNIKTSKADSLHKD